MMINKYILYQIGLRHVSKRKFKLPMKGLVSSTHMAWMLYPVQSTLNSREETHEKNNPSWEASLLLFCSEVLFLRAVLLSFSFRGLKAQSYDKSDLLLRILMT
jgi:hypothetical protein